MHSPGNPGSTGSVLRRRRSKIAVDTALLVGFLTEFITREGPDYGVHSWVGILLVPVIALHLLGNAAWIRRVTARGRTDREFALAVLNAVLGLLTAVCIVTGFPIWLEWSDAGVWPITHTITGFLCIILMFMHLWRNRSRIGQLAAVR
ncbi:MAG: hypothetical protein EX269_14285 [Acidimicrobiales bacterium]|nr:MAG: hypothetical protein EX269_14285 [Acidimicrobiales bacterium]